MKVRKVRFSSKLFVIIMLLLIISDVTIGARSTAQAFEPLDWLLEEAVLTDQEKGGTA